MTGHSNPTLSTSIPVSEQVWCPRCPPEAGNGTAILPESEDGRRGTELALE